LSTPLAGLARRHLPTREVLLQQVAQLPVALLIIGAGWFLIATTQANLEARGIRSGFGFLGLEAGIPIGIHLIAYDPSDTYGRAFAVGIVNTLVAAVSAIVLATTLGVLVGLARVSRNWAMARLATIYVELFRNVPLLLVLIFVYSVVLATLPAVRGSLEPLPGVFLNQRGLYAPRPLLEPAFVLVLLAAVPMVVATVRALARLSDPGAVDSPPAWRWPVYLALPLVAFYALGRPASLEIPELRGFNFQGGVVLRPEFTALVTGLVLYTAAFIAETVRAGIQSVSAGQIDAALSIGLTRRHVTRLVILPLALRVMIPATTNDYESLVKNTSLAVAIGYPDMVSVGSTIIGQNGQAIEIVALWMGVYLTINLLISLAMNSLNRRVQLVEH
jgi:general L-amino acid transport system permease protein